MTPTLRMAGGWAGWAGIGFLAALGWLPVPYWGLAGALLLALFLLDAVALARTPGIGLQRQLPAALALGHESEITLLAEVRGAQACRVMLHDRHPGGWPVQGQPCALKLEPGRETRISYRLRPLQRGLATFAGCDVRQLSPLGLWFRQRVVGDEQQLRVYPNFAPLARFALINAERATRITGAHLQRRRGEGTEFHQLREFRIGDSLRQVDWKATARLCRPISRDYQDERNQQVLLLLDTGRRMLAKDDALSHFDHVLNAALVLGYLALRQGDAVGFMTAGAAQRWLPPQRGAGAINTLLNSLYDLEASPIATDYRAAASTLMLRQKRRALILFVGNLRDEDMDDLTPAVQLLAQRHLVCVASLREQSLDQTLVHPPVNLDEALLASGTAQFLAARRAAHERLRRTGVNVLDVTCAQLPAMLTEAYLSVKRSGRL